MSISSVLCRWWPVALAVNPSLLAGKSRAGAWSRWLRPGSGLPVVLFPILVFKGFIRKHVRQKVPPFSKISGRPGHTMPKNHPLFMDISGKSSRDKCGKSTPFPEKMGTRMRPPMGLEWGGRGFQRGYPTFKICGQPVVCGKPSSAFHYVGLLIRDTGVTLTVFSGNFLLLIHMKNKVQSVPLKVQRFLFPMYP